VGEGLGERAWEINCMSPLNLMALSFIPLFPGKFLQVFKLKAISLKKIFQLKLRNTLFPLEKGVRGLFSTSSIIQNNKNIYPDRKI